MCFLFFIIGYGFCMLNPLPIEGGFITPGGYLKAKIKTPNWIAYDFYRTQRINDMWLLREYYDFSCNDLVTLGYLKNFEEQCSWYKKEEEPEKIINLLEQCLDKKYKTGKWVKGNKIKL